MRVALSLGALAVMLALLELVFATFFPQPLYAVTLEPWGPWHEPNATFVHAADPRAERSLLRGTEFLTHIHYDDVGFRGPDYPLPKPAGTRRVLVLGDSYGEALEVELDRTFAQGLERSLNGDPPRGAASALPRSAAAAAATGTPEWVLTRAIWSRLRDDTSTDGARLVALNIQYHADEAQLRRDVLTAMGVTWLDAFETDPADRERYHFHFDGHWNDAGHARVAALLDGAIRRDGLLPAAERYEVINASMTAFSTCQELTLYELLARRYQPDLVVVVYTATDDRNLATQDMCALGPDGALTLRSRTYSTLDRVGRTARSLVREHSHFLTWITDRIDAARSDTEGRTAIPVPAP